MSGAHDLPLKSGVGVKSCQNVETSSILVKAAFWLGASLARSKAKEEVVVPFKESRIAD